MLHPAICGQHQGQIKGSGILSVNSDYKEIMHTIYYNCDFPCVPLYVTFPT